MDLFAAALLGVVQGLTEFLPVSSSGHLILARAFFGWDSGRFGLPFDVACHVGTLLAVVAFYQFQVTGRTAQFCMLVLLYPAFVLHARRLHDMGQSAWLLLVPILLMIAAFAIWLKYWSPGAQVTAAVPMIALVVAAGFALWGCIGNPVPVMKAPQSP